MSIDQLEAFIAAAEELNFTRAAKKLYIAQSSLSQKISEMENLLEVTLFNRTKRSVSLTPAGEYFYHVAVSLVSQYTEGVRKTKSISIGKQAILSVGFYGQSSAWFMPHIIYDFRQEFPDVEIFCQEYASHRELTNALREKKIDAAVTMQMGASNSKDLDWHPCLFGQASAVLWRGHPLSGRKSIRLEELRDETFVFLSKSTSFDGYYSRLMLFQSMGLEPKKIIEANTLNTMMTLVCAREAVAIHSMLLQRASMYNLSFVPLEDAAAAQMFCIGAFTNPKNGNSLSQVFCHSMEDTLRMMETPTQTEGVL